MENLNGHHIGKTNDIHTVRAAAHASGSLSVGGSSGGQAEVHLTGEKRMTDGVWMGEIIGRT